VAIVADNPSKLGDKIYITKEQLKEYRQACTNNGYIEYNSETKEITSINNPLCFATLLEQLNETTFYIKVFDVGQFDGSVTPSKLGDKFWISYEDYNRYKAVVDEGNAIVYDIETKAISIIEVEPTFIPLSQQAKPLYQSTLGTYGSGYLWNRLTKAQQKELTAYLDGLDAIAHDEEHNATELPTKPDFIK
jgi:hypothetical protein